MTETFVSTSDGRWPCLRHKGLLHYCSPDDLAAQLGLAPGDYILELDPGQAERDRKATTAARTRRHNRLNADVDYWGV